MGNSFSVRARASLALVGMVSTTVVALVGSASPAWAATYDFVAVASSDLAGTGSPAISGNGRFVAFDTAAPLLPADTNTTLDVYVLDRETGTTELVNDPSASGGLNVVHHHTPAISADGDRVMWTQSSYNMGAAGSNVDAVLVKDRSDGTTTWINQAGSTSGVRATGDDISDDGTAVVFTTEASADLFVPGISDTNGASDVIHTRIAGAGADVTLTHSLVSLNADNNGTNDADSWGASVSPDGVRVAYLSLGTHYMTGVDPQQNVWGYSTDGGTTWPITGQGTATGGPFTGSDPQAMAGGQVVFLSDEPLDPTDANGTADVYRWSLVLSPDRTSGTTNSYERLSGSSSGGDLNGDVLSADVAADGSTLVYATAATNVLAGVDTNGASSDVYRAELWDGGTTDLVNHTLDGTTHAGDHTAPVVSDAGSAVAFVSPDGLASADGNGSPDVVLATVRATIETSGPFELVSRTPSGFSGNDESRTPSMSNDGRFVAYASRATDIAPGGEYSIPPARNIHVHDRAATGAHTVKLMVSPTVNPNGDAYDPWISGNGRYVAFTTQASNLLAADPDNTSDVIVWDTSTDVERFRVASVRNDETAVTSPARIAAMSDNGRYVLFLTAESLDPADGNTFDDLYLRDLSAGNTELISGGHAGATADYPAVSGDVSDDGRWVVFLSGASNLSATALATGNNVYLRDRSTATTTVLSDEPGGGMAVHPRISATGATVAFVGKDHIDGTTFAQYQAIAYDTGTGEYRLLSHAPGANQYGFTEPADATVDGTLSISADGQYVAFASAATNLVAGETDAYFDLFVHDRMSDTVRLANDPPDATGTPAAVRHPAIDNSGTVVAWEDPYGNYFPAGANPDDDGTRTSLSTHDIYLATSSAPVPAGPRTVEDVSLTATPGKGGSQAGLDRVPIAGIPVESIPFANVALAATPLRSIDLEAAPLRSIPLRSIPLRSIPLRSITLSQLPLDLPGGWAPRLVGTTLEGAPLQAVTLGQVEAVSPATDENGQVLPHPLDGIDLSQVGIQSSPLRSIGIASIALGSTPLRSIPLRSIDAGTADYAKHVCPMTGAVPADGTQTLANWEALLDCLGFGGSIDGLTSLIDIDIAGAPLRSIPLRSIPLRSIDLQSSPLRSIPLRSIELQATPLRSIPLRSIELDVAPLRSIPLRSIPLRSIDVNPSPLRSIPLRSIPLRSIVVDCNDSLNRVDCSDTSTQSLGDVADISLDLIIGDLGDIGAALEGFTLGDLMGAYGDVTIGDVLDWVAAETDLPASIRDMSLIDLLVGLLLKTDYPWEQLPVADMGLQNVSPTPELVDARLSYRVTGDHVPGDATTVTVTLPAGARYAPGTSSLDVLQADTGYTTILDDPAVHGNTLTYTFNTDHAGSTVGLALQYRPGVRLVTEQATASISFGGTPMLEAPAESAGYDVTERSRFDDDPATAPLLASGDTLVVGHIADAGDIDYYRIPATVVAGKRVSIDLAVPGVDQDLVMYSPADAGGVIDAAPLRSIPLRSIAVEDQGAVAPGETVPPETLQDIPLRSIPLRSISANRDATDERVDVLANEDEAGFYTIQVSGYNGATSTEPYVLRMRLFDPPAELECSRTLPHPLVSPTSETVPAAPPGTDTLFVVNPSRIDATYGAGQGAAVVSALDTLAGRSDLGVHGHVLAVDGAKTVRDAYTAWDRTACSPNAANEVVDAIVALVEASHASAGGGDAEHTIPNVVLVGADDVLPQARIPDLTRLSNERDYLADIGTDNPLAGAFATEHLLSDDPYGDRDPIPWLNRLMYVPDAALGRLVETPSEIIAAVERFQDWKGTLDPTTATATGPVPETPPVQDALVTGYDFLTDGATEVANRLATSFGPTNVERMIDESWTRQQLVDALLGPDVPYVAAVNAHFDHYRSLPALGNATHSEDDLFTTADVVDPDGGGPGGSPALDKRLLFSMGCHSGLSVPDVYVAGMIEDDDWAQTFARQGAGAFVGNTGYGYGDTAAVALSELLMADFAERLDGSMTVGQAMVFAKQAYAGQLGIYGAYDEKVLAEATFYGLPMFRVKGQLSAPVAGPKVPTAPVPAANVGVSSSTFAQGVAELAVATKTAPDGSTFLTAGGEAPQVTSGRPITPRIDLDVTADTDVPARGVLLTGLTSSETPGTRVTFARAVVDDSTREPATATDVAFPASFAGVNRFRDPSGERSSLVLLPGQFVPDDDPGTVGVGTRRQFSEMAGVVYYSDDPDVLPPTFAATSARANASTVTFEADVSDLGNAVMRVLVLYREDSGPWRSAELAPTVAGPWRGSGPATSEHVEYLVQAVDTAGNVATTSNKGFLYAAAADATPPTVEIASPAAQHYEVGTPLAVDFACADANLRACDATLNGEPVTDGADVDTSAAGAFNVLEVTGTDAFGNTTTTSVTFHIGYTFGGFAAPVASGQRTEIKAGSTAPVRWQLTDANGYVSDRSAIVDIRSSDLACDSEAAATATLGSTDEVSGLKYDTETDRWMYVWKTERAWKGTCRQLVITFADGQTASAVFTMT